MMVLNHIIKNPNQTENQIVTDLKGKYSRVPIRKTLRFLSKNNIIIIKQINSNKYEIIPNYNHLLVILMQDLKNLDEKTLILIHQLELAIRKQKNLAIDNDTIQSLYFMYQHQILVYLLKALFVWPSAIKDNEMLGTMYLTLFTRLRDILTTLEIKISSKFHIAMKKSVIDNLFNLNPDAINQIVKQSKKYDIDLAVEKVLDIIWKNGLLFAPEVGYKFHSIDGNIKQNDKIPNDWRDLVKY